MRSPQEIWFRARQEAANLLLLLKPPIPGGEAPPVPLAPLPSIEEVSGSLCGSALSEEVKQTADAILEHRLTLFSTEIQTGREIRWRRDPVHGHETGTQYFRRIPYLDYNSAGDHKFIWELNRHQHLVVLAQAFALTGDDRFVHEIEWQLESWWRENPFQRGINWASALEVAFRSLSWIWVYHLAGGRMSAGFSQRFLTELYRHGCHLEWNLSVYFSPNTHLLGEAVALHAIGHLFPRFPRATRWRRMGRNTVLAQMGAQVRPDGSHFEQSSYYHVYATDMFLFHHVLEPAPASYVERLGAMAEYLDSLMDEDGVIPLIGDDDGGRFFYPYGCRRRFGRATLATCAAVLNRPEFPFDPADLDQQAVWWLRSAPLQPRSAPHSGHSQARLYRDAGLVILKSRESHVTFDAGPFGRGSGGHSHADTLSITIRHMGEDILADAGTFTYVGSPEWRSWFRGTAAHSTIRVDNRDQALATGAFRWSNPPEVRLLDWNPSGLVVAQCSYSNFTHQRTLRFTPELIVIKDDLDGPAGDHDIEQFWHAGVGVTITQETASAKVYRIGTRARLAVATDSDITVERGDPNGWISTAFGFRQEANVIIVRRRTRLPLSLETVIALQPHELRDPTFVPAWAQAVLGL